MPLAPFLHDLFDTGHVRVDAVREFAAEEIAAADREQATRLLVERERLVRQAFPGQAPKLEIDAAIWAATILWRACQAAVFRDLGQEHLAQMLSPACPLVSLPAAHYSVDLALVFLPDLERFASAASASDPLCTHLRRLGQAWPLSSVGMRLESAPDIAPLLQPENLFQYYVDRVLARQDAARRADPRVEAAVAIARGAHPDLPRGK